MNFLASTENWTGNLCTCTYSLGRTVNTISLSRATSYQRMIDACSKNVIVDEVKIHGKYIYIGRRSWIELFENRSLYDRNCWKFQPVRQTWSVSIKKYRFRERGYRKAILWKCNDDRWRIDRIFFLKGKECRPWRLGFLGFVNNGCNIEDRTMITPFQNLFFLVYS